MSREPRRNAKSSTKKMANMDAMANAAANGYEAHISLRHGEPSSSYAGESRWMNAVAIYVFVRLDSVIIQIWIRKEYNRRNRLVVGGGRSIVSNVSQFLKCMHR